MSEPNEAAVLLQRAEILEDHLRVLIEEGLFSIGPSASDELIQKIEEARTEIRAAKLDAGSSILTRAERDLVQVTFERGLWWRLVKIHQLPIFAYFLAVFAWLLWQAGRLEKGPDGVQEILGVPVSIMFLGGMGAVLRGLWWLYRKVSRRQYRTYFLMANLSAPFVGALLAFFAYLLMSAGILSLEGTASAQLESAALLQAVAFLSGYSWEWIVERVDRVITA